MWQATNNMTGDAGMSAANGKSATFDHAQVRVATSHCNRKGRMQKTCRQMSLLTKKATTAARSTNRPRQSQTNVEMPPADEGEEAREVQLACC